MPFPNFVLVSFSTYVLTTDTTGDSWLIVIFTSVELNTSLFCASAFAIKPIISKFMPSFLDTTETASRGNTWSSKQSASNRQRVSYGTSNASPPPNDGRDRRSRRAHTPSWEQNDDVELDLGNPTLGVPANRTTSKIWRGNSIVRKEEEAMEDDRSHVRTLSGDEGLLDIRRRVSVEITEIRTRRSDSSVGYDDLRGDDARHFEPL
jgi:hypothetical protein